MSTSTPSHDIHPIASSFTSSGQSGLYDRARPSYPSPALSHIFSLLFQSSPSTSPKHILEFGAGTGIFTRLLLSPPPDVSIPTNLSISQITAVEPSPGMRASFTQSLQSFQNCPTSSTLIPAPSVEIYPGTFASPPSHLSPSSIDAIIIAQAFHWSHPSYASSLISFSHLLKPNAPVFLIWNMENRSSPHPGHGWVSKIRDIYEKYEEDTPQYRHLWWMAAFDTPEFSRLYKSEIPSDLSCSSSSENSGERKNGAGRVIPPGVEYKRFERVLPTTEDAVVERVFSKSYITALGEEERKVVEEKVRDVVRSSEKVWIDEEKGVFEYPYETDLYVFWKKGEEEGVDE